MRDREVDERDPEDDEQHHGRELHALGERADDQRRRDAGEGHLEGDEDDLGDDDAVGEGRRRSMSASTPFRNTLAKPPTKSLSDAAVGEGQL